MFNRLATLLSVRADERRLVLLVAVLFACIQAGQAMGDNSASALFLLRFGVDFLPYMYIFLGAPDFYHHTRLFHCPWTLRQSQILSTDDGGFHRLADS